jgi:hypothetical protein
MTPTILRTRNAVSYAKKQYLFIFLSDFEWFVFQHTTVWGMQHIVWHHASQNAPVFLIARRNHLMVWTSCNEAESQARMPFTAGWKNADWLCLNEIREVSAMAKKKAHMGCTIPVYNIYFVPWPLLGTEPCNVVWILITMCVWIV